MHSHMKRNTKLNIIFNFHWRQLYYHWIYFCCVWMIIAWRPRSTNIAVAAWSNAIRHRKFSWNVKIKTSTGAFIHGPTTTYNAFFTTRLRSTTASSSSSTLTTTYSVGDTVTVKINVSTNKGDGASTLQQGVIHAVRGRGWYAVQLLNNKEILKIRGTQLQKVHNNSNDSINTQTSDQTTVENNNDSLASEKKITIKKTNKVSETRIEIPVVVIDDPQYIRPFAATSYTFDEDNMPPPPTIYNLDTALQDWSSVQNAADKAYLQQVAHHSTIDKWVVFTDLHCCPANLSSSLQVLETVHALAVERQAGVLFLGDWWHYRGTLRVDCLNAVLQALASWTVPMVMIPGNHDQVTLGGHHHSLTPLLHAYRVAQAEDKPSLPGPLIFSYPTLFRGALFVPHIRDSAVLESILQSQLARHDAKALFCHADVFGAFHNDFIRSDSGVDPSFFPPQIPIYSGHFHKPHKVMAKDVCIEYLGSPFQVSLAEAQQQKALAVVDASQNWQCIEKIPILIGRRHFPISSIEDFLKLQLAGMDEETGETLFLNDTLVQSGDRVVVSLDSDTMNNLQQSSKHPAHAHIQQLRNAGVAVEVRQVTSSISISSRSNTKTEIDKGEREIWSTSVVWTNFLKEQVQRGVYSNDRFEELRDAGLKILQSLEDDNSITTIHNSASTYLEFTSLTVEGLGSFRERVSYPLANRGLVLLRGANKDGGSDSNGSGKSTLAMSALWALTGSLDPRPFQDSKVADLVNDDSNLAKVTLKGTLNGAEFIISRTKTSNKGMLTFFLKGEDLTTQSVRETQMIIDEKLNVNAALLARSIFHSQHGSSKLLESHDTKFKEELALVVPLAIWQAAVVVARKENKIAKDRITQIDGMIEVRSGDLQKLQRRLQEAENSVKERQDMYDQAVKAYKDALAEVEKNTKDQSELVALEDQYATANLLVSTIEDEYDIRVKQREIDLQDLQKKIQKVMSLVDDERQSLHNAQRDVDRYSLEKRIAETHMTKLEQKWNVTIGTGDVVLTSLPTVCPTCNQPLSMHPEGHSDHRVVEDLEKSFHSALTELNEVTKKEKDALDKMIFIEQKYNETVKQRNELQDLIDSRNQYWTSTFKDLDNKLSETKSNREFLSSQITTSMKQSQNQSKADLLLNTMLSRKELLDESLRYVESVKNDVADAEELLQTFQADKEENYRVSSIMGDLSDALGQRGVPTYLMQNAIQMLESSSQKYLSDLIDGALQLGLSIDEGDRILRRAYVRGPTGEYNERPLAALSGGQWRRCSLALDLGFVDLIARRGNFRSSLIILDEPLTHLDRSGRTEVGRVMKKLLQQQTTDINQEGYNSGFSVSTVICILQDLAAEELEEAFDHIDEVIKEDGSSRVQVDEETL